MSLMNQVLKDLEQRRNREHKAGSYQAPLSSATRAIPPWLPWAVLAVVIGLALFAVDRLWFSAPDPVVPVTQTEPADAPAAMVETPVVEPVADPEPARPGMRRVVMNTRNQRVLLEFEFDGAIELRAFNLTEPNRLVLDFIGADPSLRKPLPVPSAQQALSDWVYSEAPDGSLRLTLELNARASSVAERPAPDFVTATLSMPAPPRPAPVVVTPDPVPVEPPVVSERTLVTQSPRQRAEAAFSDGIRLLSEGRRGQAEAKFREAVGHDASLVDARVALVNLLVTQGHIREAELQLQEGLRVSPGQPALADRYARLLLERGDLAGAIGVLSDSAPALAAHPEHHALLAALLQRAGHHESAAAAYSALVEVRPDQGLWWMGLGISLEALQRHSAALGAYRRATEDPRLSTEVERFIRERVVALSLAAGETP